MRILTVALIASLCTGCLFGSGDDPDENNEENNAPNNGESNTPNNEPNVQPNAEPNLQPNGEPNFQPNAEPNLQPNGEPNATPNNVGGECEIDSNCSVPENVRCHRAKCDEGFCVLIPGGEGATCGDCGIAPGACNEGVCICATDGLGTCSLDGADIGTTAPGERNMDNDCEWCDPGATPDGWTVRPDGSKCETADGLSGSCIEGQCAAF